MIEPPRLSIIVPVYYKQSDFSQMRRWISDIVNWQLPHEVILVQDGCSEVTFRELQNITANGTPIPVTHLNVNLMSPAKARNIGLDVARGEWILFCDSDDFPHLAAIDEVLLTMATKKDAVVGSFEVYNKQDQKVIQRIYSDKLIDLGRVLGWWRVLIRRDRIGSLRLIDSRMGEDAVFVASLRLSHEETYFSNKLFYTYIIGSSDQLTANPINHLDLLKSLRTLSNVLTNNSIPRYAMVILARTIITSLYRLKRGHLNELLKWLFSEISAAKMKTTLFLLFEITRLLVLLCFRKRSA